MKVNIICVGKIKENYLKTGIAEYEKRLKRFCDLEIIEVNDEKIPERLSDAEELNVMKKEAERIKKRIKDNAYIIVLDVKGERMSSKKLSIKFEKTLALGKSRIIFIIGGSLGIDNEILNMADFRFSMSDLTFAHQMIRLFLIEQIYRTYKIINNETYHK